MAKLRPAVPDTLRNQLLVANRRCCCVCHQQLALQFHHIDENPANNNPTNLAVLCVACHSRVSGNEGHGRGYSAGEVRLHKTTWEAKIARDGLSASDDDDDDDDDPITVVVEPEDDDWTRRFDLDEGQFIYVKVKASRRVNVGLASEQQYGKAQRGKKFDGDYREHILEDTVSAFAEKEGVVVLWLENDGEKEAEVELRMTTEDLDDDEEVDE